MQNVFPYLPVRHCCRHPQTHLVLVLKPGKGLPCRESSHASWDSYFRVLYVIQWPNDQMGLLGSGAVCRIIISHHIQLQMQPIFKHEDSWSFERHRWAWVTCAAFWDVQKILVSNNSNNPNSKALTFCLRDRAPLCGFPAPGQCCVSASIYLLVHENSTFFKSRTLWRICMFLRDVKKTSLTSTNDTRQ